MSGPSRDCSKTADAGATWTALSLPLSAGQVPSSIAVAPSMPKVLYATTSGGSTVAVFRSADAGVTWTAEGSLPVLAVYLVIDPFNPSHVLAWGWDTSSWQSNNGGALWTAGPISSGIVFDPATPGVVYSGVTTGIWSFPTVTISKSTDGGVTFTPLSVGPFGNLNTNGRPGTGFRTNPA